MVNTFTENYEVRGDGTVYDLISLVGITPVSVVHTPTKYCQESYDITFKTFVDMMLFTKGYFGNDYSDNQITEMMGW